MKYLSLIWAQLFRSKTRTLLTLFSVIVAFLLFGLLDSVRVAFTSGGSVEGANRLIVASRLSITQSLPVRLESQIRTIPGVRDVIALTRLVHSVDSVRLAQEIDRRSEGPMRVLVEVNVAEEPSKGGIVPPSLRAFVEEVSEGSDLVIGGLMVMPPLHTDPEASRPWFAQTRELAERLAGEWCGRHDFGDLSMGTSQDYIVAAEEGATKVRVGRGLLERARTTSQGLT